MKVYLAIFGVENIENLTQDQGYKIFSLAVVDFYMGKISIDELSGICRILESAPRIIEKTSDMDTDERADAIIASSELAYLTRRIGGRTYTTASEDLEYTLNKIRRLYEQSQRI